MTDSINASERPAGSDAPSIPAQAFTVTYLQRGADEGVRRELTVYAADRNGAYDQGVAGLQPGEEIVNILPA